MWKPGVNNTAPPHRLLALSSLPFIRLFNARSGGTGLEAADVSTTSGLAEVAVT